MIIDCEKGREKVIYDKFKQIIPLLDKLGKYYTFSSKKEPLVGAYVKTFEVKNPIALDVRIAIKPDLAVRPIRVDPLSVDPVDFSSFKETLLPTETDEEKELVIGVFDKLLDEKIEELEDRRKKAVSVAKGFIKRLS